MFAYRQLEPVLKNIWTLLPYSYAGIVVFPCDGKA